MRDGRAKFGKNNRIGFFAGIIHCPTSRTESVSLPCLENGRFGVFPFSLPFPAVVNRVSILVDRAGEGTVLIGIYDASGKKRCEVAVDISRMGPAIGIFPNTVNISEGDYFLTWGSDTKCDAELRGIGVIDQLNLLNASGTALMGSARSQPGRTLPDTLGVITPNSPSSEYRPNSIYGPTYAPILAYFKA